MFHLNISNFLRVNKKKEFLWKRYEENLLIICYDLWQSIWFLSQFEDLIFMHFFFKLKCYFYNYYKLKVILWQISMHHLKSNYFLIHLSLNFKKNISHLKNRKFDLKKMSIDPDMKHYYAFIKILNLFCYFTLLSNNLCWTQIIIYIFIYNIHLNKDF